MTLDTAHRTQDTNVDSLAKSGVSKVKDRGHACSMPHWNWTCMWPGSGVRPFQRRQSLLQHLAATVAFAL
jgi:hypothetical protein